MNVQTALDLFAGCGGAALGLHRAGWQHLACVERDPAPAATLAAAGLPVLRADIREVDWTAFAGRVDLLWASPPCQPGSTAGKRRGTSDDRDGWPWTWGAVDAVRPTWFLAENVLGWTYHARTCSLQGDHRGCVGCAWEWSVLPALRSRFAFSGAWKAPGSSTPPTSARHSTGAASCSGAARCPWRRPPQPAAIPTTRTPRTAACLPG